MGLMEQSILPGLSGSQTPADISAQFLTLQDLIVGCLWPLCASFALGCLGCPVALPISGLVTVQ